MSAIARPRYGMDLNTKFIFEIFLPFLCLETVYSHDRELVRLVIVAELHEIVLDFKADESATLISRQRSDTSGPGFVPTHGKVKIHSSTTPATTKVVPNPDSFARFSAVDMS